MIVHQWLASRLLADREILQDFPADLERSLVRQTFYLGSVAPDMGMLPGGDPFVSNLAHYIRSGSLCAQLVDASLDEVDRAFAWGWLSHCLADALIHPLVNCGAGELVHGSADRPLGYAFHPAAHVRVELGLDAACLKLFPQPIVEWPESATGAQRLRHLERAYCQTYGDIGVLNGLKRSLRAARRRFAWWVWITRSRGSSLGKVLTCCLPSKSALRGLFRAHPPAEWLLSELNRVAEEYVDRFRLELHRGRPSLPDFNLDTGELESARTGYPLAAATLREWKRRGGRFPQELQSAST
jgi:hypothetical protein